MIFSLPFSPSRTMRRPCTAARAVTCCRRNRAVVATTYTNFSDWSLLIAQIGNQDRLVRAAARQAQPREQSRREEKSGLRKDRPAAHRARVRVEAVVDEIHVALVRKLRLFIGQREVDRVLDVARAGPLPAPASRAYFRNADSSASKVAVDRVERDDRRQQRRVGRAAADQVAFGHLRDG